MNQFVHIAPGRRAAGAIWAWFGLMIVASPALALSFEESDRYLDPPLPLPQQISAVIRAAAAADPVWRIDRIRDVLPAIRACWQPAALEASGRELTVRLAFRRTGEIIGAPRITYAKLAGRTDASRNFVASVLTALSRCAPLPFTRGFGAAIAGRPFTFRFIDDRAA